MEKAKPEGAIRHHDGLVSRQHTHGTGVHGAAARMRWAAGSTQ